MKTLKSGMLIAVLFFVTTPVQKAVAAAEIAAGVYAENLVADIENGLTTVIRQMETSTSVVSFAVRSDLLVVLENVRQISNQLIGKTFGELSQSQKQFFERTNKLVQDYNNGVQLTAEEVDGVVNSMGETISRLPTFKDRPYVTRYSPSYAVGGENSYRVSVKGSLVGSGEPTLTFSEHECSLKTKTERSIEFDCTKAIFPDEFAWVAGELKVFEPKPWYAFFGDAKSFSYTISLRSVPARLGTYSLTFVTDEVKEIRKPRDQSNYHRNNHCQGGTPVHWTYTPESGCKVDVTTVSAEATTKSSNSSFGGVSNVTANGFSVTGNVNNAGSCGPKVFGAPAGKDGRGALGVTARWVDVCTEATELTSAETTGELFWKKQKSFTFPPNTKSFLLSVKEMTGDERVVRGTEPHNWFTVDYDSTGKVAVFRPKDVQDALK